MECPRCGSKNVTYSHRRGIEKILRFFYPSEPYRCKECWTRFWKAESRIRTVLSAGTAVIIAGAAVYYFAFMPGPEEDKHPSVPPLSLNGKIANAPENPDKDSGIKEEDIPPSDRKPESGEKKPSAPAPDSSEPQPKEKPDQTDPSSEQKGKAPEKSFPKQDMIPKSPESPPKDGPIRKSVVPPPPDSQGRDKTVPEDPLWPERESAPPSVEKSPSLQVPRGTEEPPLQVKAAPRTLKRVLSQDTDEEFEISLSADGPIRKYSRFALNPPPKLVLDLPGKWKYPGDTVLPVESDAVGSIRVGVHSDMLRVVIDLKGRKTMIPDIEETQDGIRLIIKK